MGVYRRQSRAQRSPYGESREKNRATCPVCGAEKGQTCFTLTKSGLRELSRTHSGQKPQEPRRAP